MNRNGCDCLGTAPVNGTLIDGVIPSTDTTQRGIWARELFVVNRNGQDSFTIGFEFNSSYLLRYVQVIYLDCLVWGIGSSAVNVYSSNIFPAFLTAASTNIGMLSLAENILIKDVLPSELFHPTISMAFYFIEFIFGGSSTCTINWLHLAEIRFSDVAPTVIMPTTLSKLTYK